MEASTPERAGLFRGDQQRTGLQGFKDSESVVVLELLLVVLEVLFVLAVSGPAPDPQAHR
jgi:hypothetical protein